ncbi:MAG: pilus assembly protein TadG-related protein [Boseongicola sp.]
MKQQRNQTNFRHLLGNRVTRFERDESGSLIAFSLFIFICMIMFGGIAVDLMLYENQRTHLQNSTDRAVLAAANLDQTVDPAVVVQDYLAKSGINIDLDDVTVTEVGSMPVITGRQVSVDIDGDFNTMLMNMVGVNTLPLGALSEATEAINDIEVSLVLDVSGSMGSNQKLERMQDAANDFVAEILAGSEDGRVSMSLVPYSTQVSAGPELLAQMNTEHNHDYSHCVNFAGSSFSSVAIDHTVALSQTAHFDPWRHYNSGQSPRNYVCRNESYFDILPWTNDIAALTNQINAFEDGGNTSIDVAVKWGAALLDPSMSAPLDALITSGDVPAEFAPRPFAYTRDDTLKFIVVMTDGINTTQYYLDDPYKEGQSPIYVDTATGRISTDDREWQDRDNDDDWWEDYWYAPGRYWIDNPYDSDGGGSSSDAVRLDWLDVWATMSVRWRAYHLHYKQYNNASDYYDNYNNSNGPRRSISASTKESRMDNICTAAKDEGVVIFAIGFEVTDSSADVMRDCASTPNHFYRVEGLDIEYAFASIANQINQLKLTQ